MRCCAVILLLLVTLAAPAWGETKAAPAARIPRFKPARDWQISYLTRWYGEDGQPDPALDEPLLMVSYKAPDLVQVKRGGSRGFVAVSNRRGTRLLRPARELAVWSRHPVSYFFHECNVALGGLTAPLDHDWDEVRAALAQGGRGENATFALLPDEVVAGRPCVVLRFTATASGGQDRGEWTTTQWFDREYGVTLALRWKGPDRETEVRAKSAKFNVGLDMRRFALRVPKRVREFHAPAAGWGEARIIENYLRGGARPVKTKPFLPVKVAVAQPTALPEGFSGPYRILTGTKGSPEGTWDLWQMWLSPKGMISLDQSDSPEDRILPGDTVTIGLRGGEGEVATYDEPFDGVIITWQEGGRYHWLEATGVTAAALRKMAEGMKEVTLEPLQGD